MSNYIIAKDEQDWHAIRSKGLGGSDVSSVLGFNKYKSAFELWNEKVTGEYSKDVSNVIAVRFGHAAENLVAELFEEATGLKVRNDNKTYQHKEYPFLLANIDRHIVGEKAILECKTTSVYNAKQWDDDNIPENYLLQVQHYLNVLDYDVAYIAVLIGNQEFKYKKIERDQELLDMITPRLVEFWTVNVMQNVPPKVDGSQACGDFIKEKYSVEVENDDELELSSEYINACELALSYKQIIADTTTLMKEQENIIKQHMGDSNVEKATSQRYKVSWKFQPYSRLDAKRLEKEHPDIYREYLKTTQNKVFRLKEIK